MSTTTNKKKIILKKLKTHDTIWHPESKLVFKSQKVREVIGMYDDSEDTIIPLGNDMVRICKTWKFKINEEYSR